MSETLPSVRPGPLERLVAEALDEDRGRGDVTTAATVPAAARGRARIVAKAPGVLAGLAVAREVYRQVDPQAAFEAPGKDGDPVRPGDPVAAAAGAFASLLLAERTALNFLQRLSGIATLTARYVDAVRGTGARIVDTRKTTPGWRAMEKAAVRAGGGGNHRKGLYDAYLVKENHIIAAGGIREALAAVSGANRDRLPVEIEVRTIAELELALTGPHPPDRLLLDNFELAGLADAVRRARALHPRVLLEASGNVDLTTVRAIAETGVDWISVGALTHSAPALDLSCLIDRA
ncbi:MAG TPA: carboxylating nicotinate-nucleotide diphosphorylase [Gemmatimonadota bacterium]|nr:carboxylating nicotinate-nucleotide diphosphorylase [Gemmatimonadota bacterium]